MSTIYEGMSILPESCNYCGGKHFGISVRAYFDAGILKCINSNHDDPQITCIDCEHDFEPNEPDVNFTEALAIKAALKDGEYLELQCFAMTEQDDGEGSRIAQRGESVGFYDLVLRAMRENGEVLPDCDFILEFDDLDDNQANELVAHIEKTLDIICDHIGE